MYITPKKSTFRVEDTVLVAYPHLCMNPAKSLSPTFSSHRARLNDVILQSPGVSRMQGVLTEYEKPPPFLLYVIQQPFALRKGAKLTPNLEFLVFPVIEEWLGLFTLENVNLSESLCSVASTLMWVLSGAPVRV